MDAVAAIAAKVEAKRRELDDARAHVARVELELRVWQEAAETIRVATPAVTRPSAPAVLPSVPRPSSPLTLPALPAVPSSGFFETAAAFHSIRKRGLNAAWRAVFGAMAERYPAPLSLDAIGQLAAERGFQIKPDTVRGMLSAYVREGFAERLGPGQFRVTAQGAAAAGASLPAVPPAIGPDAPPQIGPNPGLATVVADDPWRPFRPDAGQHEPEELAAE